MAIHSLILKKHFDKIGFDDNFFRFYETEATDKMLNMSAMCEKLHDIFVRQDEMTIYTDFDVDGIMSSVVAHAGFSELGFKTNLFKPIPADGYGFRIKDVDGIIAEFPNTSVIFTGDVGIAANEAIEYAQSKGIIVLVTDHHIGEYPCKANIAVNPNQYGETYSHRNICGSYVIYKLLEAYSEKYCSPYKQSDIYRLQVFAGLATISDVMPLLYENRQLVRNSVSIMRYFFGYELKNGSIAPPMYSDNYSRAFVGLKKLLEYFQRLRKIKTTDDIDEQFYGFYLVPFLNSCKRMDGDMRGVYDVFFSDRVSPIPGFESMSCVETGINYLDTLNNRRKEVVSECFEKLLAEKSAQASPNAAYMNCEVYIARVGAGICGLLANKLMGLTGMPTLVLVEGEDGSFQGSGRNPGWIDFAWKLREHGIPIECKGHKEAFGVFVPNREALDSYITFFNTVVAAEYQKAIASQKLVTDTSIIIGNVSGVQSDFFIDTMLIHEYLEERESYHPYGQAFPEPKFKLVLDTNSVFEIMFGGENQHVKFITNEGIEVLLFNMALDLEKLKYDNRDKNYVWVCEGTFKYDTFNNADYDTICFFGDDIYAMELK